jgi:hypothetical protein
MKKIIALITLLALFVIGSPQTARAEGAISFNIGYSGSHGSYTFGLRHFIHPSHDLHFSFGPTIYHESYYYPRHISRYVYHSPYPWYSSYRSGGHHYNYKSHHRGSHDRYTRSFSRSQGSSRHHDRSLSRSRGSSRHQDRSLSRNQGSNRRHETFRSGSRQTSSRSHQSSERSRGSRGSGRSRR